MFETIKTILKNPFTIWIVKLCRAKFYQLKFYKNKLKIGYNSYAKSSTFGYANFIKNNVTINKSKLDNYTYVSDGTKIQYTTIGKFCSIGPECQIGLGKHPVSFVSTHPAFYSTSPYITFSDKNYYGEFENISIGNDVWIGSRVIVLDGVTISDGAIVAAGSLVTKNVPPYAIVGGVPAKIIKYRFEKEVINKLLQEKWWNQDKSFLKNNFYKFHSIDNYFKINKNAN